MFKGFSRPLLFAHRGASMHAPENTIESFEIAANLGADILELDVHQAKDGEVVVIHDARLERTTNGRGAVHALTYPELYALDAGYHFRAENGDHRFRGRDVFIPRLEDVLRGFPGVGFNIELKVGGPSMIRALGEVLERVGLGDDRILLTAGDPGIMQALEQANLGCSLGSSSEQVREVLSGCWLGRPPPESLRGRALQIPPRWRGLPVATRRLLQYAHSAGMEVHIWTINDPSAAQKWLQRGVDGLMTDDPTALAGVVIDFRGDADPSGRRRLRKV